MYTPDWSSTSTKYENSSLVVPVLSLTLKTNIRLWSSASEPITKTLQESCAWYIRRPDNFARAMRLQNGAAPHVMGVIIIEPRKGSFVNMEYASNEIRNMEYEYEKGNAGHSPCMKSGIWDHENYPILEYGKRENMKLGTWNKVTLKLELGNLHTLWGALIIAVISNRGSVGV